MTFKVYSRFEMLHKALKKSRTRVWTFEGRCNGISKCKEITCATVAKTFPSLFSEIQRKFANWKFMYHKMQQDA